MTITPGVPMVRHLTVDVHSREFLRRLSDHGGACTLGELYPVDYEGDKARRNVGDGVGLNSRVGTGG
jgi:hypothetical protein